MTAISKIEWTNSTWNPITGCSKISTGCQNCYAYRMAIRLQAAGNRRYKNGFNVTLHEDLLQIPLQWSKSRLVFVNSMSDLFHEEVPLSFIKKIFQTMKQASEHTFQVLTKRSVRMVECAKHLEWPSNVWMGVSVESNEHIERIKHLSQMSASVRFVSFEPLLGPIHDMDLTEINWVIVGGESGPGARTMKPEWARLIRDYCSNKSIPFFFKQWGGVFKKINGRTLDGEIWNQMPQEGTKQFCLQM